MCGRLLRLRREGRFSLVTSPAVLAEARTVLARDKFRRYVSPAVVEAYLASLETVSEFREDPADIVALTPDSKDDYLIALAVAAGTDFLVSGDKHLADLAGPPVPVLRPRQFLQHLET